MTFPTLEMGSHSKRPCIAPTSSGEQPRWAFGFTLPVAVASKDTSHSRCGTNEVLAGAKAVLDMSEERDGDPTVPIICSRCGTESRLPVDDIADAIATHNDRVHDGEEHAEVDPAFREQIADLAASDLELL
ncbi:hypothetical protein [Halobaculum sp. D14]|uniref:hypothetical protein n=1 Tax=Halobaculum sp. D14 TaxID=3421642 RepID=UPI003EBB3A49